MMQQAIDEESNKENAEDAKEKAENDISVIGGRLLIKIIAAGRRSAAKLLRKDEARRMAAIIAKLPGPRGVGSMRPITPMSPATPIRFPDKTDFVQTRLPLA